MARTPANAPKPEALAALERWPRAPEGYTEDEILSWDRLGRALMASKLVTAADLVLAEETARVMARVRRLYADDSLKPTILKGWLDLETKMLAEMGLSPRSRKSVAPPAKPDGNPEGKRVRGLLR